MAGSVSRSVRVEVFVVVYNVGSLAVLVVHLFVFPCYLLFVFPCYL